MASAGIVQIERRQTVVEAIAQELIRYIAANGLTGGDQLPSERTLVKMLGTSRLPLREALCVLKGLGIVEARHGKGVFVKRLDLAALFSVLSPLLRSQANINLAHLFEARVHLEGSIVELAAASHDDENMLALRATVSAMRASLDDREAYIRHDMDFHQELARSTGNPIFEVFMSSITDLLDQLQFLYMDEVNIREAAIIEHEEIFEAVATGDSAGAKAAMVNHLRNATSRIG